MLSVNRCHNHSQEKTSSRGGKGGKQGTKDVNGANLDLRTRNLAFSTAWLSPMHASSSDKQANSKGFIFKRRLHDQRTCDYRSTKSGTTSFGSLGVVLLVHDRKKETHCSEVVVASCGSIAIQVPRHSPSWRPCPQEDGSQQGPCRPHPSLSTGRCRCSR